MDAEEIPVVVSQVDPEVEETLVPLKEEIVDENVQLPESASLPNVPQVVQENGEEIIISQLHFMGIIVRQPFYYMMHKKKFQTISKSLYAEG